MAIQNWNGHTMFAMTAELNDDARIILSGLAAKHPDWTDEYRIGQALDRAFALLTEAKNDAEEIWKREEIEPPAREEYLQRAKDRALTLLSRGDIKSAIVSILSDLEKREDTRPGQFLIALGIGYATENDHDGARRFISGFR